MTREPSGRGPDGEARTVALVVAALAVSCSAQVVWVLAVAGLPDTPDRWVIFAACVAAVTALAVLSVRAWRWRRPQ